MKKQTALYLLALLLLMNVSYFYTCTLKSRQTICSLVDRSAVDGWPSLRVAMYHGALGALQYSDWCESPFLLERYRMLLRQWRTDLEQIQRTVALIWTCAPARCTYYGFLERVSMGLLFADRYKQECVYPLGLELMDPDIDQQMLAELQVREKACVCPMGGRMTIIEE